MDVSDLQGVQARLAGLPRAQQGAVSFAVVEMLRPLAELGGEAIEPAELIRLVDDARAAMESADALVLGQVLARAEAMPVLAADDEPPGSAVFTLDVLACLIYAIKTMTEPEPAPWSGYCVQRAYDCMFFADEALGRSGSPAWLMRAVEAWLDGDGGDRLRREAAAIAGLPGRIREVG